SRWANNQYYHPRSLTVKPANRQPVDSVAVRFYFTDRETEKLLVATGCATCSRPSSAYELGISQYSDPDTAFENGSVSDDQQGSWGFIGVGRRALVPFDKGYYAEFMVGSFSEFWLNNGGLDKGTPLPVKLMEFRAVRSGRNALLDWSVGSESSVLRYEVEVARGAADLQSGAFVLIGAVPAQGNSTTMLTYSFTDTQPDKFGVRYYRLKVVNADGTVRYSAIRPVTFPEAVAWSIYPNPSEGLFFLTTSLAPGEQLTGDVYDARGRRVLRFTKRGVGGPQKTVVDLKSGAFASGVYLLKLTAPGFSAAYRIYKK
ncbi:MAG: family serine peptidase, partial [Flaviaesturariibacter sp.]|nr:family serine peptidase [Flaviaesturariibacter sp.]